MGFFSRIGNKISHGLQTATRVGKKALGTISRVGNKIATQGSKIVGGIERIPILGQALAPITGIARSAIGLVRDVADVAGTGEKLLGEGENIIRAGSEALRTGDVAGASDVLRRGKDLVGTSKSTLERARQVKHDAVKVATRKP